MAVFAVADIHSHYEPLMTALREASFFENNENKLIVLGDALDRGEDANKVAELLLELHRENRLIYIKGNHEDLLDDCLDEISNGGIYEIACGISHHYTNGTFDTLLQLASMSSHDAVVSPNRLVRTVRQTDYYRKLLPSCVNYYESGKYIFCHGWIPTFVYGAKPYLRYAYNADFRNATEAEWRRARWFNGMELACRKGIVDAKKTVVCGHWHTSWGHCHIDGNGKEWGSTAVFTPFYADGIIALDACTAQTKKVNCIRLDDAF